MRIPGLHTGFNKNPIGFATRTALNDKGSSSGGFNLFTAIFILCLAIIALVDFFKTDKSSAENNDEVGKETNNKEIVSRDSTTSGFLKSKNGKYLYTVDKNGCSLRGIKEITSELVIPESIDGKAVRVVSSSIFESHKEIIESVIFPNTVNRLEYRSFSQMKALKRVVLSKGISILPMDSFIDCDALEEIVIPDGVKCVQSFAARNCVNLSRIIIYSDSIMITDNSFSNSVTQPLSYGYKNIRQELVGKSDYYKAGYGAMDTDSKSDKKEVTIYAHSGSETEKIAQRYGYRTAMLQE
ncbi:MAG: leucine-rich repeat protein [Lachnospiraceae bacterium]|nr:leucine-rich repeat protein [Lachnospiraceae bacterium]